MQPAQCAGLGGKRMVVLYEFGQITACLRQCLPVPCLGKPAARITKAAGRQDQDLGQGCGGILGQYTINFCKLINQLYELTFPNCPAVKR